MPMIVRGSVIRGAAAAPTLAAVMTAVAVLGIGTWWARRQIEHESLRGTGRQRV